MYSGNKHLETGLSYLHEFKTFSKYYMPSKNSVSEIGCVQVVENLSFEKICPHSLKSHYFIKIGVYRY